MRPDQRVWASRFGDAAYAVVVPRALGQIRRPWRGPRRAATRLTWRSQVTTDMPRAAETSFTQLDDDGFTFTAATCSGRARWSTQDGDLTLYDGAHTPLPRVQMLQEALFAACYGDLLRHGGLLLHAAVLWLGGAPFVVSGPSTAGKSTLAARFPTAWWSDEHAFLRPDGDRWVVLRHVEFRGQDGAFPWLAPLGGLLWLGPDRTHTAIQPLTQAQAVERLIPQAMLAGPLTVPPVLAAVAQLTQAYTTYELSHNLATPADVLATCIAEARHVHA